MVDVSVVLPIYNIPEPYLVKCIDSVICQSIRNIEIILINDGSSNNALEVCNRYALTDNRIKVIDQINQGVSVARNAGIENANGSWIAFVDPDDWLEVDYLESMLKKCKDDIDIVICNCIVNSTSDIQRNNFLPIESVGIVSDKNRIQGQLLSKVIGGYYPEHIAAGVPWGKLFRKAFIDRENLKFVPGMTRMQDNIFCLYALHYSNKIYYTGEYKYNYRKEDQSASFKFNKKIINHFNFYFSEVSKFIEMCLRGNQSYKKALNAKILTSVNSYLLNYYFHKKNDNTFQSIKKELNVLLATEPYRLALQEIDYSYLNKQEKLFVFLLSNKMFLALKMIYTLKKKV